MSEPSYAAGPTDVALLEETVGAVLRRTASEHPDGEALVDVPSGRRWTWAQLDAAVDDLARALLDAGLQPGDRVGIWAPNTAEWTLTQFATARVGVVLVTVNPAYRTSELQYVLQQSGCRWLVAAPSFRTSDYRAMVAEVRGACPALERVVFLGDDDWQQLAAGGTASLDLVLSPTDPVNIQYTSGTTGFPKGATLSHRNILNNGYFVGRTCRYTAGRPHLHPGALLPLLRHGHGQPRGRHQRRDHGRAGARRSSRWRPCRRCRTSGAPRCTASPRCSSPSSGASSSAASTCSSLRTGIMAGSPCPVEVMKRVVDEMGMEQVTICYGMTETSPVSTQSSVDDPLERRVSTVGRVHPHVEVQVVDPDTGQVVPRGQTGEFCTRGYSVMLGYWDEPAKTAEAIDADGWMHTGDLAVMDDEGYLNIVGRIKDMVIRGGENVYPREVEEFLYGHPAVDDVQVVGVPDPRYGEELCAWVRLKPGASLTRGRAAGLLQGPAGALQGAALPAGHRRVPDDRHRQGAEVQDARGDHLPARARRGAGDRVTPMRLELVIVPVSDVDRAKEFYVERAGFTCDVDHRAGEDFRVVQLTPPGSACSVTLMRNPDAAGSVQGLHLVVDDLDVVRAELLARGCPVSELFHFGDAGQAPGPHPTRADHGTFATFSDPDGTGWMLQEVRSRAASPLG